MRWLVRLFRKSTTGDALKREAITDSACMMLIREICKDEGWCVTLDGGNPEFEGPNYAVEVYGDWPKNSSIPAEVDEWRSVRFTGQTHIDCLRAALKAKGGFDEFISVKLLELRKLSV